MSEIILYEKKLKPNAQKLRKEMTKWEKKLWYGYLKNYPVQFRRQKPIGNYIADFYCIKAKLVIELDGSQHYMQKQLDYDSTRTAYLENLGLLVLRYPDNIVSKNFEGVCLDIDRIVKERIG